VTDQPKPSVEPSDVERQFWNTWNARFRETTPVGSVSERQGIQIGQWLSRSGRSDLRILDFGCGSGWLSGRLTPFGRVTAIDLSDEVVTRARARFPEVNFLVGDVLTVPLESGSFDAVVSLEVLSHVADQPAYLARAANLLRPGGELLLATQNRFVLQRLDGVSPVAPGQRRRWVGHLELRRLLAPHFRVEELTSLHPTGRRGILRLVNSYRLERLLLRLLSLDRINAMKERLLLGHTLMVRATKRTR
jgi:2-polyprenyl-3-methyl-5-hydroxy-6-metoxy-1,4-benzoquinol methylase